MRARLLRLRLPQTVRLAVAAVWFVLLMADSVTAADVTAGISRNERIQMVAAAWITGVYLFATGATIGSFLNVVVYRLPRGQNLRRPKSRCPHCHTQLRWYDNLPVVGWILVGGRCRYCRAAISPRYPLVEAVCGTWFLAFGYIELLSGGASLPLRGVPRMTGALWIVWAPQWELIGIYVYHLMLCCWLLVLAAWMWDRQRVPGRAVVWLLVMGAVPAVIWPNLRPVGIWGATVDADIVSYTAVATRASNVTSGIVDGLVGLVVGASIGTSLARAAGENNAGKTVFGTAHVRVIMAAVGLMLGWQAAVGVAVPVSVVGLAVMAISGCRQTTLAATAYTSAVATLLFIATWQFWGETFTWLLRGPTPGAVVALVIIIAATETSRVLAGRRPSPMY